MISQKQHPIKIPLKTEFVKEIFLLLLGKILGQTFMGLQCRNKWCRGRDLNPQGLTAKRF